MFATILATITVAVVPVQTCHLSRHGNADGCTVRTVAASAGLHGTLRGHETVTWQTSNPRGFLGYPLVNGRRGRWNFDHTQLDWPHVTFDGRSFVNSGNRAVDIFALTPTR